MRVDGISMFLRSKVYDLCPNSCDIFLSGHPLIFVLHHFRMFWKFGKIQSRKASSTGLKPMIAFEESKIESDEELKCLGPPDCILRLIKVSVTGPYLPKPQRSLPSKGNGLGNDRIFRGMKNARNEVRSAPCENAEE